LIWSAVDDEKKHDAITAGNGADDDVKIEVLPDDQRLPSEKESLPTR